MSTPEPFTIVNIGTLSMNKFWGETERVRSGTATCTLLRVGDTRLLVDPSPWPDDLARLLFDRAGLRPAEIDLVYVTHFHGDHRFGLELFDGKPWLMAAAGLSEWRGKSPQDAVLIARFLPAEGRLPEGLRLAPTPGHTWGHHALSLGTRWGPLLVAGDAVMTPEFYAAEEGYHNSVDFPLAAQTIRDIKQAAKLVIPGHGNIILNL